MFVRKNLKDKPMLSKNAVARLLPLLRGNVMAYISIGSELDTTELINALLLCDNVTLYAPYTENGEIMPRRVICVKTPNKWGNMPEECYSPSDDVENDNNKSVKLDYCVTPLLGFNYAGYRIGYGKGCYDKFFARNSDVYKIGLAFECQRVEFTPDENDVPLDCCVTEHNVIYF